MKEDRERLYFIVKSWLSGQVVSIFFLVAVIFLGVINWIQSVILGTSGYIISLIFLRVFDIKIDFVVKKILNILDKHKKIKKFILKHF